MDDKPTPDEDLPTSNVAPSHSPLDDTVPDAGELSLPTTGEPESDLYSELFVVRKDMSPDPTPADVDESTSLASTSHSANVSRTSHPHGPEPQLPPRVRPRKPPVSRPKRPHAVSHHPNAPTKPTSLNDVGLTSTQLSDMILRAMYLQGSLTGFDVAGQLRLPYGLVDQPLRFLCDEKCLEVVSGQVLGRISYRFQLTDLGRTRAREAFEQCRYVGPAPVKLSDYVDYCRKQAVAGTECDVEKLTEAFSEIIIRDGLVDELGPAVCSGRSVFLYGPPGNGKTMVAKGLGRLLNEHGGDIFVPYAIQAEGAIITLFDPTLHRPTDEAELSRVNVPGRTEYHDASVEQDDLWDLRWRRVRRPVVITGGELTLDMLDLKYNATSNFYQAPLHIKANGGVFLVDDFGRQIVSPKDLLNRWIVPLEEKIDYLTLATGKKFQVPFEQLTVFSTNLDPKDLVDDAFLRRIRHKIEISTPDRPLLEAIFQFHCQQRGLNYDPQTLDMLYRKYYDRGREPRSSDARDLIEIAQSIAQFRGETATMSPKLIGEAAAKFFADVTGKAA